MASKPSIPKGTRDFGPREMRGRNYIFNEIRGVFERFGYPAIETPSMEQLSTLLGKYGEEGDKLLFKILNSGDPFSGVDFNDGSGSNALALKLCEKGLRYDLTVPFARFVVQHQNEISFPFKRYQIQPVWRADRPQKGRYREFYQCDVDVVGSPSLLYELELVQIVEEVFSRLGIRVVLKINNRKILAALAEGCGAPGSLTDITVAIDKIDKIGLEAVKGELLEKGLSAEALSVIEPVLTLTGDAATKMDTLERLLGPSDSLAGGLAELRELFSLIDAAGVKMPVELDLSLARGLNYYTGAIFEVKALDFEIGSICGGGRYDNLTGIFGLPGLSGVGISFGADRIYDVMAALDLFPKEGEGSADILFACMGEAELRYILPIAARLRAAGVRADIYPEKVKLRKQFEYADRKGIKYLAIAGEEEMAAGEITIKNLASGEQRRESADKISGLTW